MQKLVLKQTKILHILSEIFNAVVFKLFPAEALFDFRGQCNAAAVELVFEHGTYACLLTAVIRFYSKLYIALFCQVQRTTWGAETDRIYVTEITEFKLIGAKKN
jgi:hypothetical protein